jgi:hypothetical protein
MPCYLLLFPPRDGVVCSEVFGISLLLKQIIRNAAEKFTNEVQVQPTAREAICRILILIAQR